MVYDLKLTYTIFNIVCALRMAFMRAGETVQELLTLALAENLNSVPSYTLATLDLL